MSREFLAQYKTALLLLLTLLASLAHAQELPTDFSIRAPLTLSGEGPWYRLEVPMALHFSARFADLRDIRVFNAEGQAQAYALTLGQAPQHEQVQSARVKWFPLRGPKDAAADATEIRVQRGTSGTLIEVNPAQNLAGEQEQLRGWVLDVSAIDAPLEQLLLNWTGDIEGFQRFSIEASDDLQSWQHWGEGQIARMRYADQQLEQRRVSLPGLRAHYLRLLWLAPQQAPSLTEAKIVSRANDSQPAPMAWSIALAPSRVKPGEYSWDLPLALPVERIKIVLPQSNTLAPVQLFGRREPKLQWQLLSRNLLYRLPQEGKESRQEQIELFGASVQQLKLQVDQRGGGLGPEAPQLQIGMRTTELVFLARGNPPFTLVLGNGAANAANLPMTTLIPGFVPARLHSLGIASVAAGADAVAVVNALPTRADTDWQRIGLWAVLLIGVGLLAGMALSLLRASAAKP
jgi:hypothetical protein